MVSLRNGVNILVLCSRVFIIGLGRVMDFSVFLSGMFSMVFSSENMLIMKVLLYFLGGSSLVVSSFIRWLCIMVVWFMVGGVLFVCEVVIKRVV